MPHGLFPFLRPVPELKVVNFDLLNVLYFIVPLDSQSLGQDDPLSSFWSDLSFKGSYIVFAGM